MTSDDSATSDRYDPIRLGTWLLRNIMIPTGSRAAVTPGTWYVPVEDIRQTGECSGSVMPTASRRRMNSKFANCCLPDALPAELASKLRETLEDLVRGLQSDTGDVDRSDQHLWSVLEAVRGSVEGGLEDEDRTLVDVTYLVDLSSWISRA